MPCVYVSAKSWYNVMKLWWQRAPTRPLVQFEDAQSISSSCQCLRESSIPVGWAATASPEAVGKAPCKSLPHPRYHRCSFTVPGREDDIKMSNDRSLNYDLCRLCLCTRRFAYQPGCLVARVAGSSVRLCQVAAIEQRHPFASWDLVALIQSSDKTGWLLHRIWLVDSMTMMCFHHAFHFCIEAWNFLEIRVFCGSQGIAAWMNKTKLTQISWKHHKTPMGT